LRRQGNLARGEVLKQQIPVIIFGFIRWQLLKQISQAIIRLQAVGLGGFDQAIQGRTGSRSPGMAVKQPVFPPWNCFGGC